jgi:hypothetical protein
MSPICKPLQLPYNLGSQLRDVDDAAELAQAGLQAAVQLVQLLLVALSFQEPHNASKFVVALSSEALVQLGQLQQDLLQATELMTSLASKPRSNRAVL